MASQGRAADTHRGVVAAVRGGDPRGKQPLEADELAGRRSALAREGAIEVDEDVSDVAAHGALAEEALRRKVGRDDLRLGVSDEHRVEQGASERPIDLACAPVAVGRGVAPRGGEPAAPGEQDRQRVEHPRHRALPVGLCDPRGQVDEREREQAQQPPREGAEPKRDPARSVRSPLALTLALCHALRMQIGQRIGRYEVVGRVGQGGIASVYRVRHVELGSIFALKLLDVQRPQLCARLLAEGRAQASLVHPNVVRVSDVLTHEDMPVLIMEFVEGPTLDQLLEQRGRLPLDQLLDLSVGITRGLRAAHTAGLVHRDLKPGNVLVARTADGLLPKIADFGLVKVLREDRRTVRSATQAGITMGTPLFMAPEQIRDARSVDHRADLYSLGCILYLLLAGVPPFASTSILQLYEQILLGPHPPSIGEHPIPAVLDALVMRLLRSDPDERPSSCSEVLAVLESPEARDESSSVRSWPSAIQAAASSAACPLPRPVSPSPKPSKLALAPLLIPVAAAALGLAASEPKEEITRAEPSPAPIERPREPAEPTAPQPTAPQPTAPQPLTPEPPLSPQRAEEALRAVSVRGDAVEVWLSRDEQRWVLPADVPDGTYTIFARFPERDPVPAGALRVEGPLVVSCSAFALRCKPQGSI